MMTERRYMSVDQTIRDRVERQRLRRLWWAVVLIWAGLALGADSMGLVPQIGHTDAWSWIFLGAGTIGIMGSLYRLRSASIPNPTTWDWIWASFCLIVGLGDFTSLEFGGPLILILVGGAVLANALWRRD